MIQYGSPFVYQGEVSTRTPSWSKRMYFFTFAFALRVPSCDSFKVACQTRLEPEPEEFFIYVVGFLSLPHQVLESKWRSSSTKAARAVCSIRVWRFKGSTIPHIRLLSSTLTISHVGKLNSSSPRPSTATLDRRYPTGKRCHWTSPHRFVCQVGGFFGYCREHPPRGFVVGCGLDVIVIRVEQDVGAAEGLQTFEV